MQPKCSQIVHGDQKRAWKKVQFDKAYLHDGKAALFH